MAKKSTSRLVDARNGHWLVKFTRPFERGSVNGYVMAVGSRWFLLAILSDENRFNGFMCCRLSDVRELQVPYLYSTFAEAALKKRGERLPKRPRIGVASTEGLLLSANRAFPLVTVHREKKHPGVCNIGRVVGVNRVRVSLLEIGPDASWDTKPSQYRLDEITRIDFGGGYEEALHLVGGEPKFVFPSNRAVTSPTRLRSSKS